MLKTVIYLVYFIALVLATIVFVVHTYAHFEVKDKIKTSMLFSVTDKEMEMHRDAHARVTIDLIKWTAISIGGIYACFDCFVSLINTL